MKCLPAILALALLVSDHSYAKVCGEKDAEAADMAVDSLTSWQAIQQNSVKYGYCDDASIAEGNSEAVARMLVDKWEEVGTLQLLISHDDSFKKYVLTHINSTLDTEDLELVVKQSSKECPTKIRSLCSELELSAQKALSEQ